MRADRLERFADYLEKEISDEDYDGNMDTQIRLSALGHAANCFAFQGIDLVNMGFYEDIRFRGYYGMMALMTFFDLDHKTAMNLFCAGSRVNRLSVVDRIREELP